MDYLEEREAKIPDWWLPQILVPRQAKQAAGQPMEGGKGKSWVPLDGRKADRAGKRGGVLCVSPFLHRLINKPTLPIRLPPNLPHRFCYGRTGVQCGFSVVYCSFFNLSKLPGCSGEAVSGALTWTHVAHYLTAGRPIHRGYLIGGSASLCLCAS